jgi:hypothetical protein
MRAGGRVKVGTTGICPLPNSREQGKTNKELWVILMSEITITTKHFISVT